MTNEMFDYDDNILVPTSFLKICSKISKITFGLSFYLFDYFSTESGKKELFKTLSIKEIKKELNVSESSIRRAINEIIDKKIFLVYEDNSDKEKTFDFFMVNEKNKQLFEKLKTGEVVVTTERYYTEKKNDIS